MSFFPETLFAAPPFSLRHEEKVVLFGDVIGQLTRHHAQNCEPYLEILRVLKFDPAQSHKLENYPFIPARLFKQHELRSVAANDVKKTMTSSGTSGQTPSRIFLDNETAILQSKALNKIVGDFIGTQRLPMLVIDAPSTVKAGGSFSARAAGIVGFSLFGRDVTYALRDNMTLDIENVENFLKKYEGQKILAFGFTFVIYLHFLKALEETSRKLDMQNVTLIHGGGWKKLVDLSISNDAFKKRVQAAADMTHIHNYYGTIEQTGSIFVECEQGHLHASNFSDIIIRDAQFNVLPFGQRGLVEMISLLPHSYPGHVLLTEDEGTIIGEDNCACGRKGKYFHIHGRAAQAEARGCSDTYVAQ